MLSGLADDEGRDDGAWRVALSSPLSSGRRSRGWSGWACGAFVMDERASRRGFIAYLVVLYMTAGLMAGRGLLGRGIDPEFVA